MVPAKDPPKVKLEKLFHNSRMPEVGELCVPCFMKVLGFYSSVEPTSVSCVERFFPYGEDHH